MAGLVLSNSVSSNAYKHEYIWCVRSIFVKQPNWGIGEEGNSLSACSWPVSSCWVCKKPSFGWPGTQGRLRCHLQVDRLLFSGLQGSLESISFEEHHTFASDTPHPFLIFVSCRFPQTFGKHLLSSKWLKTRLQKVKHCISLKFQHCLSVLFLSRDDWNLNT